MKAHFRLAKCLFELQFFEEACKCLEEFKNKFPDQAQSRAYKALDMDIQLVRQGKQSQNSSVAVETMSGKFIWLFFSNLINFRNDNNNNYVNLDEKEDSNSVPFNSENPYAKLWDEQFSNYATLSEQEKIWRNNACDYETRYCGHCNTTTDIKEANFFGRFA